MKQRLIHLAVIASSAAALLLTAIWIRSFYARDLIAVPLGSHYYHLTIFPQHFYLDRDDGWPGMTWSVSIGLDQIPSLPRYAEVRLVPRYRGAWSLALPFWLPLLFLAAAPTLWLGSMLRKRHYVKRGLCPACGYDLRASIERCPECGNKIEPQIDADERR